jgi:hypothetical protein
VVDPAAARQMCLQWIDSAFGNTYLNDLGDIIVPSDGTTAVLVSFEALPTGQVLIEVRAPVLEDIDVTPGLFEYVAWNSATFQLGSLSLHRDSQGAWLQFSYAFLAEVATHHLTNQLVATVGQTADRLSRELQPKFGGSFISSC